MRAFDCVVSALRPRELLCWLLLATCAGGTQSTAATVVFATQFEVVDGYSTNFDLAGQNDWIKYGSGGNGVIPVGNGQKAYIGFEPPTPGDKTLFLLKPIGFEPLAEQLPVVRFSTLMSIEDSTNLEYDFFQWSVFNINSNRLFTLDFDNFYTNISYALDGTNPYVSTGMKFVPGKTYTLTIVMNFASNLWSAALDATVLVTNLPMTTTGLPLTLGDVDAVWDLYDTNQPGNNYMLFDNYRITAEPIAAPPPPPRLTLLGRVAGLSALRLTGAEGYRFAIEASTNLSHWAPLKTVQVVDGSSDYIDTTATLLPQRFYRASWVP